MYCFAALKEKENARLREEKTQAVLREERLLGIVERFADGVARGDGVDGSEDSPAAKRQRTQPIEAEASGQVFQGGRAAALRP